LKPFFWFALVGAEIRSLEQDGDLNPPVKAAVQSYRDFPTPIDHLRRMDLPLKAGKIFLIMYLCPNLLLLMYCLMPTS
jgi:hypothetical protein